MGPRRRLRFVLDLGADDLTEVIRTLEQIALDLTLRGEDTANSTSGGWAGGYHYELAVVEPEMTGERYRSELTEFVRQERAARRATG